MTNWNECGGTWPAFSARYSDRLTGRPRPRQDTAKAGHLSGVLRLRDLLMAPRNRVLSETMIKTALHVNINATLRDLKNIFRQDTFLGAPVTDDEGKLAGVNRSSSVREAANTLLAVSFAGLVPLILKGMPTDPALASGPLLTTVTDMCGFFFVLSVASLMLPRLTGWLRSFRKLSCM